MDKTFLILAHGHEEKYYQLGYNLALSMKAQGSQIPITLLTDTDKPLSTKHMRVFDHVVTFRKEAYAGRKTITPFYAKTWIYAHSPAEKTIYLDADGWALQNPDPIFDLMDGREFQTQCVGTWPYKTCKESKIIWSDPQKLYDQYGISKEHYFTEHNTSLIYFENCERAETIFKLAEYFYSVEFVPGYQHDGFGFYPDELAFSVACLVLNHRPGKFRPIHFQSSWIINDTKWEDEIRKNQYFAGLYGNDGLSPSSLWRLYLRDVNNLHNGMKNRNLYPERFKLDAKVKASEKGKKTPRYEGLKEFTERPEWVQKLIDKS